MPRKKLILICQSDGEFMTKEDGTLSYTGGEAHALDINNESLFEDMKLKLAEMCNLDYRSLSIKYFLPGNKRTLISISNDKDLKRFLDFHEEAITADLYVLGTGHFSPEVSSTIASRASKIKQAETVKSAMASQIDGAVPVEVGLISTPIRSSAVPVEIGLISTPIGSTAVPVEIGLITTPIPSSASFARAVAPLRSGPTSTTDSVKARKATVRSRAKVASSSKHSSVNTTRDPSATSFLPTDHNTNADDSIVLDMNASPADTVKKRRRTASWKIGARGPTIVAGSDSDEETRSTSSQKRSARNCDSLAVVDVELQEKLDISTWGNSSDYFSSDINSKNGSLEKMVASWQHGITGEGQDFKNVAEFRDALQKYAIANRFTYKFKKNDTNRATGYCVIDGCSWSIYAAWVPSEEVFRIKKMNKHHTCGGESWKAAHPSKSWLVSIIKDRLINSPRYKPKEIANGIFRDFGLDLNYTQVWRAVEEARQQLQGSHKEAYNQLPQFCKKIVEANPGSFANLVINDGSKFQRLFVSFHALIHGFLNGCRPLLFLDSTILKSKYHEMLLTATAIDGDDGFLPVSFAIVDVENDDNWRWFLEQLKSALSTSQSITFVSDKEKGLMKPVLEIFENSHHGYSIYHLLENFRRNLRGPFQGEGKGTLHGNLLAAAHSVRFDGFRRFTEQIKQLSPEAYDWVMQIEPEYWTSALFKGEHYNHITGDVAELYDNWIEEVQDLPIIRKCEAFTGKMMELVHSRQLDSTGWGSDLTPSKELILQELTLEAGFLKVLFSSETLFEVHDGSVNVVDLEQPDCSCLEWKLTGLPCCHAVAVFNCTCRSAYDYCSKYFSVESYRQTYSKSINPVLDTSEPVEDDEVAAEERQVLPPTTPKPPVQHKEKPKLRTVTCTWCKREGHNKITCKERMNSQLASVQSL